MGPVRQFFIYGISGAASRLAAIILVPLYTRTLALEDFGRLELAMAVHTLVVIIGGLQVESAVARDYFEALRSGRQSAFRSTALALTLVGSLAALIVLSLISVVGWLGVWFSPLELIVIGCMTLPAQLLGVQLVMLRFDGKPLNYAALSAFDLTVTAAFSAWFILGLKWGVMGALLGILAGKASSVIAGWAVTFGFTRHLRHWIRPTREYARSMLAYGIPGMPAVLVSWLQNTGNRLVLASVMPLQEVAIAGLALKAAAVFGFVIYSLRLAWEPYSISNLVRHEHDPAFFSRALERYALAMYLVLSIVLLSTPWFVRLLAPPSYGEAATVALFMMTAQYWVGMGNMAVIGVHGARQTSRLLPIYGWGAVANVAVLLVAARWLGPLVAGIGLLAGTVISAILTVRISNRIFSTNFSLRLVGFSLLATTVSSAVLLALLGHLGSSMTSDPRQAAVWLGGGGAVLFAGGLVLAVFGIGLERCRGLLLEAIQPLRRVTGA